MKCILTALCCFSMLTSIAQKDYYMLVGTYTGGGSQGIYVFDFKTANAYTRLIDSSRLDNPSFLAIAPGNDYVYAVSETAGAGSNGGNVVSYGFDGQSGKLTAVNQQSSGGNNPCYVSADKKGKWVFVGNYSSGSLAVLPVSAKGVLGEPVTRITHTGRSVNTERQNEPHVHAAVLSPNNKYLFVPDLGIDKLMGYKINQKTGALTEHSTTITKAGSGPRHLDFHPTGKFAYLVEELTGGISAFRFNGKTGTLDLLQNISTLPPGYLGYAGSADVHVSPDGKFLYASNRGESNTIAIFAIDSKTGKLTSLGHQSTMGKTPRNFNFDPTGNFLLVANQNSDEIVVFKVDKSTGMLMDTRKRIAVSRPVCIKWIPKK